MNSFSNKTIEALKMAMGFAVVISETYATGGEAEKAINACKEALEEAEKQEIGEAEIRQMLEEIEWCHQELEKIEKQEWQSLSDEEIRHLKYEYADYTLYDEGDGVCPEVELEVEDFARAIEQALKDKNKF